MADDPKRISPGAARQGRRGRPVLLVLVCGLLLAAVVWCGVEIYGLAIDERQPIELPQSQDRPDG